MMALSAEELAVLRRLDSIYDRDANCFNLRSLSEVCDGSVEMARCTVRILAMRGLAKFQRGLFDSDGMTAGSGYCCTHTGHAFLKAIPTGKEQREQAARLLAKAAGQDPDAHCFFAGPNYGKPYWRLHSQTAMAMLSIYRRGAPQDEAEAA